MDKIELAICSLEMLRALMLFDPLTGEDISLDSLNRDNRELYDSADVAITALREKADFVRCKYCEYWQDNNGGYPHEECRWGHDETPDADDFCSCGKRLEVEHGE